MKKEDCKKCGGKGYNTEEVMKTEPKSNKEIPTGKIANRHCWDCDGRGYTHVKDKKEK